MLKDSSSTLLTASYLQVLLKLPAELGRPTTTFHPQIMCQ